MDDMAKILWNRLDQQDEKHDELIAQVSELKSDMAFIKGELKGLSQHLRGGDIVVHATATGQDQSQGPVSHQTTQTINAGGDVSEIATGDVDRSVTGANAKSNVELLQEWANKNQLVIVLLIVGLLAVLSNADARAAISGWIR